MSYRLLVKNKAEKELTSLPQSDCKRIVLAIDGLAENPRPRGAKKLTNQKDRWRIRVGDYRILYRIDDYSAFTGPYGPAKPRILDVQVGTDLGTCRNTVSTYVLDSLSAGS